MKVLYHSGGAGDFDLGPLVLGEKEMSELRVMAARLMDARGNELSAHAIRTTPLSLFEATNDFNDDFNVLYADLPLSEYVPLLGWAEKYDRVAKDIARAVTQVI